MPSETLAAFLERVQQDADLQAAVEAATDEEAVAALAGGVDLAVSPGELRDWFAGRILELSRGRFGRRLLDLSDGRIDDCWWV